MTIRKIFDSDLQVFALGGFLCTKNRETERREKHKRERERERERGETE